MDSDFRRLSCDVEIQELACSDVESSFANQAGCECVLWSGYYAVGSYSAAYATQVMET